MGGAFGNNRGFIGGHLRFVCGHFIRSFAQLVSEEETALESPFCFRPRSFFGAPSAASTAPLRVSRSTRFSFVFVFFLLRARLRCIPKRRIPAERRHYAAAGPLLRVLPPSWGQFSPVSSEHRAFFLPHAAGPTEPTRNFFLLQFSHRTVC